MLGLLSKGRDDVRKEATRYNIISNSSHSENKQEGMSQLAEEIVS